MRVFSIIGNCRAKAILVQQLIAQLQELDLTVSTIKRVSDDVDLDRPSKDTYQQRLAGAQEIVIANITIMAAMKENANITITMMMKRTDRVESDVDSGVSATASA